MIKSTFALIGLVATIYHCSDWLTESRLGRVDKSDRKNDRDKKYKNTELNNSD